MDMPDDSKFVFPSYITQLRESDGKSCTYTRSDIHEAETAKLRNALDVAERALKDILHAPKKDDGSPWINGGMDTLEGVLNEALTTIKQAKGE